MSRGNGFNNFLTIDVSKDILDIKIYNETGDKEKFNAQYVEAGYLTIDKSSSITNFSSNGMLELLDADVAILVYNFEEILQLGTRQVLTFDKTKTDIRGINCTKSILNIGTFGAQYDAQVENVSLVGGRNGGRAGYFYGESRMAIFGKHGTYGYFYHSSIC